MNVLLTISFANYTSSFIQAAISAPEQANFETSKNGIALHIKADIQYNIL